MTLVAVPAAALVAFALLPLFADAYVVSFCLLMLMYLTLAGSWNIITGYAGYLALGHAAFFGLGAYASAILETRFAVPWPVGALAGGPAHATGCAHRSAAARAG